MKFPSNRSSFFLYILTVIFLFSSIYIPQYTRLSKAREKTCRETEREDILHIVRVPERTARGFSYTSGAYQFFFSQQQEFKLDAWYLVRSSSGDSLQCEKSVKIARFVRTLSEIQKQEASDFYHTKKMRDIANILLSRIQQQYERTIRRFLPPQSADIILGLLMGKSPSAAHGVGDLFRSTGLLHVLVASGANIALIFSFTQSVMRKIFSRKVSKICATILVCIYAVMIGGQPPILRALLMFLVVSGARVFGRPFPPVLSLFLTCCIILIGQPFLIYSLSFWLSVAATAGMIAEERLHPFGASFSFFSESIVVSLFTMPLLLFAVGSVSLIGIVLTTLTAWIVSPLTICALIVFFASLILPGLFLLPILALLWFLSEIFIRFINVFSSFSFLTIRVDIVPLTAVFLMYALLFCVGSLLLAKSNAER